MLFDSNTPVPVLLGCLAIAALLVWTAGTKLTRYVNAIAEKTGLGKAFTGMLLLGGITSLPEAAAVSTSAAIGNAPLAVNNLLGTASVNLILIAVADWIYGRRALTAVAATPATLMQGVLSMVLASVVAMFASAGDIAILGFGAGSAALLAGAAAAIWIASRFENRHVWEAVELDHHRREREGDRDRGSEAGVDVEEARRSVKDRVGQWPLRKLVLATSLTAAAILVGGYLLSTSADMLARATGLGSSMVGFLLVGLCTSLPEISSITAAIRMREYDMAVGDVFGTNLFNFALIFLADVIYPGGPVLGLSGTFEVMGAILAVLLTGIFLVGLLERRSRTVLRMGLDSLVALAVFLLGVAALSQVR